MSLNNVDRTLTSPDGQFIINITSSYEYFVGGLRRRQWNLSVFDTSSNRSYRKKFTYDSGVNLVKKFKHGVKINVSEDFTLVTIQFDDNGNDNDNEYTVSIPETTFVPFFDVKDV